MTQTRALLLTALCAAILVFGSGCTSGRSKVGGFLKLDTDVKLTFLVDSDINPDEGGRPSPLYVRLYALKSPKLFKDADFIELFERDKEVLGADLVGRQELEPFKPGEDRVEELVVEAGTRYVGLYAEFLQYENADYKAIFPVVENNIVSSSAEVRLTGNTMRVLD